MEIIFFSITLGLGLNFLLRFIVISKKIFLSKWLFNSFVVLFVLFLSLFIASVFMAERKVYFSGFRSTSWIFIGMTLFGIITFAFQPYENFLKPILFLPYAWVLISTVTSVLIVFIILFNYNDDLIYSNTKYRLERRGWFITACKLPSLFVKKGIVEKEFKYISGYECLRKDLIDSIRIKEVRSDTIQVTFFHHSSWKEMPNPIVAIAVDK